MCHLETATLCDQTQGQRLAFSLSRKVPLVSLKMEYICATLSIEVCFKYSTLQELHRQSWCFVFGTSASPNIIFGSRAWESTLPNHVEGGGRQHNEHSPHVPPCCHSSIRKCMYIYSFSFQILWQSLGMRSQAVESRLHWWSRFDTLSVLCSSCRGLP